MKKFLNELGAASRFVWWRGGNLKQILLDSCRWILFRCTMLKANCPDVPTSDSKY